MFSEKYNIVVIDEDVESFEWLVSRIEDYNLNIIHLNPRNFDNEIDVINEIYSIKWDLVIIDYFYKWINFTWLDIYNALDKKNPYMSKYILTSYVPDVLNDAIKTHDVLSRVDGNYDKLKEEILLSVKNYRKEIEKTFRRIEKLIEKLNKWDYMDKLSDEKDLFDLNKKVINFFWESGIKYELLNQKIEKELEEVIKIGKELLSK